MLHHKNTNVKRSQRVQNDTEIFHKELLCSSQTNGWKWSFSVASDSIYFPGPYIKQKWKNVVAIKAKYRTVAVIWQFSSSCQENLALSPLRNPRSAIAKKKFWLNLISHIIIFIFTMICSEEWWIKYGKLRVPRPPTVMSRQTPGTRYHQGTRMWRWVNVQVRGLSLYTD